MESARNDDLKKHITDMWTLLQDQSTAITVYDEALVWRLDELDEKVTVLVLFRPIDFQ